jgi:hypothetical protein
MGLALVKIITEPSLRDLNTSTEKINYARTHTEKLTPSMLSHPASLKYGKTGLKAGDSDQTESLKKIANRVSTDDARTSLTELVPGLKDLELAERGGFEPPIRLLTV